MSEVGGYTAHLYCDYVNATHDPRNKPTEFVGRDRADCRRQARQMGWAFGRDGTVKCPDCVSMRIVVLNPYQC